MTNSGHALVRVLGRVPPIGVWPSISECLTSACRKGAFGIYRPMTKYSWRTFLASAAVSADAKGGSAQSPYATAFKYDKLLLSASPDKAAFDNRSVDCPFVWS